MRDPEPVGDRLGVVNVLPRAARARPLDRLAMIVELERDPDHLRAGARGERGRDRAVDPARHGDDDAGLTRRAAKLEIDRRHWKLSRRLFTRISLLAARAGVQDNGDTRRLAWPGTKTDFEAAAEAAAGGRASWRLLARHGPAADAESREAHSRLFPLGGGGLGRSRAQARRRFADGPGR